MTETTRGILRRAHEWKNRDQAAPAIENEVTAILIDDMVATIVVLDQLLGMHHSAEKWMPRIYVAMGAAGAIFIWWIING